MLFTLPAARGGAYVSLVQILLVEDDRDLRRFLSKAFREEGYGVTETDSGDRALARALEGTFSCLVLDVMLPGRDGFSVVSELRKRGVSTPVLLLTAKDELESRVRGLEGGADDYVTKPFDLPELLARVHALIRRAELRQGCHARGGRGHARSTDAARHAGRSHRRSLAARVCAARVPDAQCGSHRIALAHRRSGVELQIRSGNERRRRLRQLSPQEIELWRAHRADSHGPRRRVPPGGRERWLNGASARCSRGGSAASRGRRSPGTPWWSSSCSPPRPRWRCAARSSIPLTSSSRCSAPIATRRAHRAV